MPARGTADPTTKIHLCLALPAYAYWYYWHAESEVQRLEMAETVR